MIDGQHVSITSGCFRREEFLRKSLPTWLRLPDVDEVLIIDWGCQPPLRESLRRYADPRIKIAAVSGVRYWEHAKCNNLEWRLASGEILLRLDADYLLGRNFFAKHEIVPGVFYCGNWKNVPIEVDDKRNLAGMLYIRRDALPLVNGYNERLIHYGKEDDDLYDRLAMHGFERKDIDLSTAAHIPHADRLRYENLAIAADLPQLLGPTTSLSSSGDRLTEGQAEKSYLLKLSEKLAAERFWTSRDHMTRWCVRPDGDNLCLCEELPAGAPEREAPWQTI